MTKRVLITGGAGFIASHLTKRCLDEGLSVVGVDNLNDYYDVSLKMHRLGSLRNHPQFEFRQIDIGDRYSVEQLLQQHRFDTIFNLAARAGVRYSMENPLVYQHTNDTGNLHL